MEKKRCKRVPNFTEAEKSILVDLVTAKKDILENKRIDTVSIKRKEDCWEQLCNEYNDRAMNISRSTISLKNCWENIKKRTKKQLAKDNMQIYKTGGGQYTGYIDPLADRVMDIIRPAIEGFSNALDSDCVGIDNGQYKEEWLEEEDILPNEQGEVLQFVNERCNNSEWCKWNSNKSKRKINSSLQIKSSCLEGKNYNIQAEEENGVLIDKGEAVVEQVEFSRNHEEVHARSQRKKSNTSNKVRETCTNRLAHFAELAECKIELVHSMLKAGQEKHELEMAIKRKQLEKEELEIELLQKELEIKNSMLKRLKKRNESENIN